MTTANAQPTAKFAEKRPEKFALVTDLPEPQAVTSAAAAAVVVQLLFGPERETGCVISAAAPHFAHRKIFQGILGMHLKIACAPGG